ncbi:MAG TPA: hypothetical protein VER96_28825 [Polyangiaceae bacterium]|nr:hypothetical protein [Polyangiaceae bacterium]
MAGSTSQSLPNAGGAGGSVSVDPTGGGGAASSATSGGSASTRDGIDFSHGTRLVFPQRNYEGANIGTDSFEAMNANDPIDLVVDAPLVDAPTYARQFEVSFGPSWIAVGHCYERKAKFAPASVDVVPDTGGTGAHLAIELVDGHYRLTHDGPGTHDVHVTGTLHVEATDLAQVCEPRFPKTAVDIPVTLTSHIKIQHLGSVAGEPGFGCGSSPVMLSGRSFGHLWLSLLNDAGQPISGKNVYSENAVDVVVETEKAAEIVEAGSGFALYGLIVTGEPQKVRLSTSYGTLFTYQLANTAMIDDWDVKFWSRDSQDAKSATYPLVVDSMPAVTPGKELGATATLKIGGSPLCGATLASDFMTSLPTPNACKVQLENNNYDGGAPGFLATFVDPAGTCEVDLSVPGANGERGLKKHLSAILAPAK